MSHMDPRSFGPTNDGRYSVSNAGHPLALSRSAEDDGVEGAPAVVDSGRLNKVEKRM
jgi:hypothetical protein